MNYPTIEAKEYAQRVEAIRAKMNEQGIDILVGFSNLLEIGIVRYYCGFAPVNESSAIVIPKEGQVIVCSGQASYDYCLVQNKLPFFWDNDCRAFVYGCKTAIVAYDTDF